MRAQYQSNSKSGLGFDFLHHHREIYAANKHNLGEINQQTSQKLAIHILFKKAMREGIINVQLPNRPPETDNNRKNSAISD